MKRVLLIAVSVLLAVTGMGAWQGAAPAQGIGASRGAGDAVHVLPVRDKVSMLVGPDGANSAVSVGDEGILVVDTMTTRSADSLLSAIRALSTRPIRWIVNTSSHPEHAGGNAVIAQAGKLIATGNTRGGDSASVYAFQEAMMRLNGTVQSQDAVAPQGWPTDSYFVKQKDMFFNGEAVQLIHVPAANSDGDTLVIFRRSDVIATGDVFTPQRYPVIDLTEGGSIEGVLAGLNYILELTVPDINEEGGTMVIPGHGHLCDEADVGDYRDMVTIVRDRVQDLVKKKMTLEQVKAAKLTFDYDGVYATPDYSGDMFVEAVYRSLTQTAKPKK